MSMDLGKLASQVLTSPLTAISAHSRPNKQLRHKLSTRIRAWVTEAMKTKRKTRSSADVTIKLCLKVTILLSKVEPSEIHHPMFLSLNVSNVGRELRNAVDVAKLSRGAVILPS